MQRGKLFILSKCGIITLDEFRNIHTVVVIGQGWQMRARPLARMIGACSRRRVGNFDRAGRKPAKQVPTRQYRPDQSTKMGKDVTDDWQNRKGSE